MVLMGNDMKTIETWWFNQEQLGDFMGFIIYDSQAASFSHTDWSLVHFRWDLCTHYKDPYFFFPGVSHVMNLPGL